MLLHVFVGDGQLVKPPEDLKTLRLTVSTSAGFGKGGREFDVGNNWTQGSFVRFHNTLVVGEVDDPGCSKLTFELKGCYKKDPAKEVVLGTAAIETKKKAKTYVLDLAPSAALTGLFGGGKDSKLDSICKLSITLYHNRFPVDLSPDEVALRHNREMLASKELKQKTKPSAREYSFLLNRKMNWDSDDAASFNKDTEKQLDKDVVTNLKDMYKTKQKEKVVARENAARGRQKLRAPFKDSEPALAYGANRQKVAYHDISPHRPTALGVGFVGVGGTPSSPPRQGKGTILYKKSEASEDPMEDIYNKMVMAEKRRLLKTNQKVKKAHFQTSLDRARAQIIAQKAKESQDKDEMLRKMMEKSDAQLKELRDEINRRKRRIAYLGLQKHISEADARKRKHEEELAKEKAKERHKLEEEAKKALRETRSLSPRRSSMNDLPSWAQAKRSSSAQPGMRGRPAMPVGHNAIPLRKAPEGTALKMSREAKLMREKEEARKELEEETAIALLEAHTGPAGAHAENSFSRSASPARPPMPIQKNRLPLRRADAVSARTRALQYKRKQEQERRAMALAAAEAAHDRLVAKLKAQGRATDLPVQGVIQHNPFPLREVPPGGTLASGQKGTPKGKVYDFSKIGSAAKEELKNGGSLNSGEGFEYGLGGSARKPPLSKTGTPASRVKGTPTNLYTFTMPDGTTLSSKSLSELEKKIADAKRDLEAKRARKIVKKKVQTQNRFSASVSKSTGREAREAGKKYATPVDQTKKYKKFYSPDYKAPDTSSADETARLVGEFEKTVDTYQRKAEAAMNKTERRTEGIAMTAEAVGAYDKLAAKSDALLAGETGAPKPTEVPGFLSEYAEGAADSAVHKKKHGSKGGKKHHKEDRKEGATTATATATATATEEEGDEMSVLRKQLESQGVSVDAKMLEIMRSLQKEQEEGKAAPTSPGPGKGKTDAMAEIEAALYRDDDLDLPTWGSGKR